MRPGRAGGLNLRELAGHIPSIISTLVYLEWSGKALTRVRSVHDGRNHSLAVSAVRRRSGCCFDNLGCRHCGGAIRLWMANESVRDL